MELDFSPAWAGWTDILRGALVTVGVTTAALVFDCMLDLLIGIRWLNPCRRFIYGTCTVYVTLVRGTPLLIQLFLLLLGLSQFDVLLPAFVYGVLGLSVYLGVYMSEIVRGTIQLMDCGQMEAVRSIGMSSAQLMCAIILLQTMARTIPPLGNKLIALIRNSAPISLLTIRDLMREGQKIVNVSYCLLEVYLAIVLMYLVLTSAVGYPLHRPERNTHAGSVVQ